MNSFSATHFNFALNILLEIGKQNRILTKMGKTTANLNTLVNNERLTMRTRIKCKDKMWQ